MNVNFTPVSLYPDTEPHGNEAIALLRDVNRAVNPYISNYNQRNVLREARQPNRHHFGVEVCNRLVSFGSVVFDEDSAERTAAAMMNVFVVPELRGNGIVDLQMLGMEQFAEDEGAQVAMLTAEPSAVNVYSRLGYSEDGANASRPSCTDMYKFLTGSDLMAGGIDMAEVSMRAMVASVQSRLVSTAQKTG